jgi:pyridoxal phosphate enzyme (YggS family)
VNIAVESGISLLGENRVQEFLSKHEKYTPEAEIHFIGGLQKNKVKYIIDKVNMIHSVDNERLLSEIERRAEQHDLVMDILLEINIAGETTKNGISPDEFPLLLEKALSLEHIRVRGLMTIPPVNENGSNELYFHKMKTLFDKTKEELKNQEFNILSMGMSQDYALAIRHGSTLVRIGSALFGQRTYVSN